MNRILSLGLSVASACAFCGPAAFGQQPAADFTYHAPGELWPSKEKGARDRRVHFPTIAFPLRTGPNAGPDGQPLRAFPNSQIHNLPGNSDGYAYPWWDNFCETRGWSMPACPGGKGHQGQDIRPNTRVNKVWDAIAMEDGVVTRVTSNTTVEIRFAANNGMMCQYLHLSPVLVKVNDKVKKGETVIGKVSNLMGGTPSTSIHLHFHCKATHPDLGSKIFVPVYSSLVAAYRRAWGLPDSVKDGVLLHDPEREVAPGAVSCPPQAQPLDETKGMTFASRWDHNCSEMGLVVEGDTRKFVYVRPKLEVAPAARRKPVLVEGTVKDGQFAGKSFRFNQACQDPEFPVSGEFKPESAHAQFVGTRNILNEKCEVDKPTTETLVFTRLEAPSGPVTPPDTTVPPQPEPQPQPPPAEPEPRPDAAGLNCPFGLKSGDKVQVVGGREIPPKSERSCNFLAVTVPGGLNFSKMPRYIREWPGVRSDVLIDKFSDQIITLRTAEGGAGMWWYWMMNRARHGAGLSQAGFGPTGKPTFTALARAMAGKERSDQYVRDIYLNPYLRFAATFFGRTVGAAEPIDLTDPESRWNLARTMFRLESGNPPVISRKQFDCGIQFGTDIHADFSKTGVEKGSTAKIEFAAFKTLEHYTNECAGAAATAVATAPAGGAGPSGAAEGPPDASTGPAGASGESVQIAELQQQLAKVAAQVGDLSRDKRALEEEKLLLEQQLTFAKDRAVELRQKIDDLEKQIKELAQNPAGVGTNP